MIRRIVLLLACLFFGSAAAHAAGTCTPTSTGVAFGVFPGTQITSAGSVTLTCTGTGKYSYTVLLSTGNSGSYSNRLMKNGTNSLSYNLYRDSARTQIWGNGTGGSLTMTGNIDMKKATSVTVVISVYGKIPAQTKPPAGTYTDSIVVTATTSQGTKTASFPVTAVVNSDCAISATNLVFGTYTGAQLDGQSQLTLTCTSGMAWNIGLNQGTFPGATVSSRKMKGPGTSSMAYSLFRNSSRTLNWGTTIGTDTVSGTGTGAAQAISVFGRIPASQILPTGGYQDTIIATVTF